MDPEHTNQADKAWQGDKSARPAIVRDGGMMAPKGDAAADRINWIFIGEDGLRAGWSILLCAFLVYVFVAIFGSILSSIADRALKLNIAAGSPLSTILGEGQWVAALAAALLIVSRLENRSIWEYNLGLTAAAKHIATGAIAGFAAITALIGAMVAGGWMRIGAVTLDGPHVLKYALAWGAGFLLVALFEEGSFRCYLQFRLSQGLNFWWAAAAIGALCICTALTSSGHGIRGFYGIALAGALPCLLIHLRQLAHDGFWYAAWLSSTGFALIHTFNGGENSIGILAAGAIAFVFCVSIRVTGSAWWAIGCHASWDWAESYFYGTADSGFAAKGHLLTAAATGSDLWSGGADGPEGSLLVLPIICLLLIVFLSIYRRSRRLAPARA